MKYTEYLTKTEDLVECHQTLSSRGWGGWGLGTRLVVTYLNGLRLPAYHFPLLLVVFPITAGNLVPLSSKECKLFIILTTWHYYDILNNHDMSSSICRDMDLPQIPTSDW